MRWILLPALALALLAAVSVPLGGLACLAVLGVWLWRVMAAPPDGVEIVRGEEAAKWLREVKEES